MLNKETVISELKNIHKGNEDLNECIQTIEGIVFEADDNSYRDVHLATVIYSYLKDTDYAKKIILDIALPRCDDNWEAYSCIFGGLSEIKCCVEAKKIIFEALEKYPTVENKCQAARYLAGYHNSCFKENEISFELFNEASKLATTPDEFSNIAFQYAKCYFYDENNSEMKKFVEDHYILALHFEEDKDYKKSIKDDMKEHNIKLTAKELKDRTVTLIKERN